MFEFTHMYSIDEIIPGLFYLAMSVAMALSLSIPLWITVNRKISITMFVLRFADLPNCMVSGGLYLGSRS
jgi:hypothetical protein